MIMYVGIVWLCGVNCWFMGDCALLFFVKIGRNCCRVYVHLAYDDGQVARNPDGLG